MKTYITGAGVSHTAGYPLGNQLLDEMDSFIQRMGNYNHRYDFKREWPELCLWLQENENPLIAEAYRKKHLEHLFTILDLSIMVSEDNFIDIFKAIEKGEEQAKAAQLVYQDFRNKTEDYEKYRSILLFALERYLNFMHYNDCGGVQSFV